MFGWNDSMVFFVFNDICDCNTTANLTTIQTIWVFTQI